MTRILLFASLALLLSGCWQREKTAAEQRAEDTRSAAEVAERSATSAAREADGKRESAKDKAIAQASANLAPVAAAVEMKGQPALAAVTLDQKRSIDAALDIPVSQYPAATITLRGLLENAEAERQKAQATAGKLQGELAAANAIAQSMEQQRVKAEADAEAARKVAAAEKARADAEASKAWWLQAGGIALGVLTTLAGLAARLGLPGGQIVSTVIDLAAPMLKKNQKISDAAVAAGDVGRSALGVLDTVLSSDPELSGKLTAKISELTKGRADKIESLFKLAAKSFVIDSAQGCADAVDQKLTYLRDEAIQTTAGIPAILNNLLTRLA
jgi:hypothetical protein